GDLHPDADAPPVGVAAQVHDDLEALRLDAGGHRPVGAVGQVVHGGDVEAGVEALVVAQRPHRGGQVEAVDVQHRLAPGPGDGVAVELLGLGRGRVDHGGGLVLGGGCVAHDRGSS